MVVPRLVAAGDVGQVDFEREGHQLGDHLGAEPFFFAQLFRRRKLFDPTLTSSTTRFSSSLFSPAIIIIVLHSHRDHQ